MMVRLHDSTNCVEAAAGYSVMAMPVFRRGLLIRAGSSLLSQRSFFLAWGRV